MSGPAIRCIVTSLVDLAHTLWHLKKAQAPGFASSSVPPSQWAGPLIEPAILRHHLRGAHGTEAEAVGEDQDSVGHEVVVERSKGAFEQGVMEETHGAGEERHVEEPSPERLPTSRQSTTSKKCPSAPNYHRQHQEDPRPVVREKGHLATPLGEDVCAPPSR